MKKRNKKKQNSRSPPPRRCYFRVLRTDENIQEIVPKETDLNKYAHESMEHLVLEHIRGGSKFGFNSPLISLTGMNISLFCHYFLWYEYLIPVIVLKIHPFIQIFQLNSMLLLLLGV